MKLTVIDNLDELLQLVQELNEQALSNSKEGAVDVYLDVNDDGLILNEEYLIPKKDIRFVQTGEDAVVKVFDEYDFLEMKEVNEEIQELFRSFLAS